MVDHVYKESIPKLRKALEKVRQDFVALRPKTDWNKLRVEPLLKHLDALEQLLKSKKFSQEFSRLRRGVELFHSDLVYFGTNVKGLERLLESEKKSSER